MVCSTAGPFRFRNGVRADIPPGGAPLKAGGAGSRRPPEFKRLAMIKIEMDAAHIDRAMSDLVEKQMPFATALTLNDAAYDGLEEVESEIEEVFDQPTRFTKKAFFVQRASKRRLSALIERKTRAAGRHYLEVQQAGGVRPQTALEKLLVSRLKYDGPIQTVTPASGARLNKHGNWSPGQRNQVLSGIKAQRDARTNTTKASKKRQRKRAGYFVPRSGSKLSPGVYQRMARGKVKKILHITDASARYDKRFEFDERVERRVREVLPKHFERRLRQALATAR